MDDHEPGAFSRSLDHDILFRTVDSLHEIQANGGLHNIAYTGWLGRWVSILQIFLQTRIRQNFHKPGKTPEPRKSYEYRDVNQDFPMEWTSPHFFSSGEENLTVSPHNFFWAYFKKPLFWWFFRSFFCAHFFLHFLLFVLKGRVLRVPN